MNMKVMVRWKVVEQKFLKVDGKHLQQVEFEVTLNVMVQQLLKVEVKMRMILIYSYFDSEIDVVGDFDVYSYCDN